MFKGNKSYKEETKRRQIVRKDTGSCLMGALDVTKALNCEFNEEVRIRNEINFFDSYE